jgi:hypothetical protein
MPTPGAALPATAAMTNGRERPGVVTMSKHEPLPPLRADVRTVAWWLVIGFTIGGVVGGLVGGVGGRGLMFALRVTSDADGIVSDDGFTIGQFTLSDSLQLYAAMSLAGAVNGFHVLEPRWFAIVGFVALPGLAALTFRRLPGRPLTRMLALGLVAALIAVGSADVTEDATELL